MGTEIIRVDPAGGSQEAIARAADVLRSGGLVAFPTETVYGLGASVAHARAVDRLRELKARPANKAFTVHVGSMEAALGFVPDPTGTARRLMRKAWPGPLTLVLDAPDPAAAPALRDLEAEAATAVFYEGTVGLRYPDDALAEALLRVVTVPVVAASANRAGQAPPSCGDDVLRELNGHVDLLLDAGRSRYAKPSTIVRVRESRLQVLREGVLDARVIARMATLRVLFVCTGNTCRSPMAAGFAGRMLADRLGCSERDLPDRGVQVASAGTAGGLGKANDHAVEVMASRGIDISGHQSAALTVEQVHQADHIFVMTEAHRRHVEDMVSSASLRVTMLLADRDLEDPIGGSREEYEACAQAIEKGVAARLQEVVI